MVRPKLNNKKPYKTFDVYNRERPAMPQQEIQRPERPDTPSPTLSSSLRFLTIRRRRVHKISRGLLHVHRNGLRTRKPTCPNNATCLGIDDIGEFMYNQARKCRHLMDEVNRHRDPSLPPITEKTPNAEFIAKEPEEGKVNVVVEIGPAGMDVEQQNCWDSSSSTDL